MAYEQAVAAARAGLSAEEFERAAQEGHAMSMEEAIDLALQSANDEQLAR